MRLGSDARAGRRVLDQRRRTQRDYGRRHWNFLGTGVALGGLVTALVAYIAPNTFLRGAVVGAGVVFVLSGIAFTVFVFTGSGSRTMGAIAETWTSSELRPLHKHGWKLIDHVFYHYADVDHLLVGTRGRDRDRDEVERQGLDSRGFGPRLGPSSRASPTRCPRRAAGDTSAAQSRRQCPTCSVHLGWRRDRRAATV